jgi:hypothetical protein
MVARTWQPGQGPMVTLTVEGQGPRRWASDELRWFLLDGESVGQPPSNFASMVAALEGRRICSQQDREAARESWQVHTAGGRASHRVPSLDLFAFKDAARAAVVRRALAQLEERDQSALRLALGPERGPELAGLGDLGALAIRTDVAARLHEASRTTKTLGEWLLRTAHRASKGRGPERTDALAAILAIREEAADWRSRVLAAFEDALELVQERDRRRLARAARARRALERQGYDFIPEEIERPSAAGR